MGRSRRGGGRGRGSYASQNYSKQRHHKFDEDRFTTDMEAAIAGKLDLRRENQNGWVVCEAWEGWSHETKG